MHSLQECLHPQLSGHPQALHLLISILFSLVFGFIYYFDLIKSTRELISVLFDLFFLFSCMTTSFFSDFFFAFGIFLSLFFIIKP